MKYRIGIVSALCVIGVSFGNAFALSEQEVDDRMHEISRSVLSPFCPGRMLSDCPSTSASELKDTVRTRIRNGESTQQIIESLYAQYGDDVRATPPAEGVGAIAWMAPALFLLFGGASVIWWLFMMRAIVTNEKAPKIDSKTRRQIEEELMKNEKLAP